MRFNSLIEISDCFDVSRVDLHNNLGFFHVGLEYVITQLKSVVLSLGMIDRYLSVEQAVLLSRLEEEYQVQHKGWLHFIIFVFTFKFIIQLYLPRWRRSLLGL